jgi:hypothetical protein
VLTTRVASARSKSKLLLVGFVLFTVGIWFGLQQGPRNGVRDSVPQKLYGEVVSDVQNWMQEVVQTPSNSKIC